MNETFFRSFAIGLVLISGRAMANEPVDPGATAFPQPRPTVEEISPSPLPTPPVENKTSEAMGKLQQQKSISSEEIDLELAIARDKQTAWTMPALSAAIPSGYGADWGTLFAGISYQNRSRFSRIASGIPYFGAGFWDSKRAIGIDMAANLTDSDNPLNGIAFSFRISRQFGETFSVAAGLLNAVWFGREILEDRTPYIAATKILRLRKDPASTCSLMAVHVGIGSGLFMRDVDTKARGEKSYWAPFGGIGVRLFQPLAVNLDYNGQDLNFGLSIAPFRSVRLVVSPIVYDLTGREGDTARYALAVSFGDSIYSRTFPFIGESGL